MKHNVEVETGSMLTRRKVFEKKVKELNKNYDRWIFVVICRVIDEENQTIYIKSERFVLDL